MADRLTLNAELQEIIGPREDGKRNVHFQPPESVKLVYPCIIYSRDDYDIDRADNSAYKRTQGYEVLVIEKDADSDLTEKLLDHFQMIRVSRYYTSDNLYHTALRLYY